MKAGRPESFFNLLRRLGPAGVLLGLPALFMLLNRGKLHLPTAQWDGTVLEAVRAIGEGRFGSSPYIIHTPLYLYLLKAADGLFSADLLVNSRVFNLGCYLLCGWLVWGLAKKLARPERARAAALAAAALYFSSPLAVQGAMLLDLGDSSLVPLAALLYYCALACSPAGLAGQALAAAAFALNLWSKLIHSFFLALAAAADALLARREGRPPPDIRAVAAGLLLFLASWAAYSYSVLGEGYRWQPLEYFFKEMLFSYQKQQVLDGLMELATTKVINAVRIALWTWPPLLLWGLRLRARGLGRGSERYFNLFILLLVAATLVSKSTSNGFPKYHCAVLPLLCALGGAYAAEELEGGNRRRLLPRAALAGALCWAVILFTGDPFFTFNHTLKTAMIAGTTVLEPARLLFLELLPIAVVARVLFLTARRLFEKHFSAVFALALTGFLWQTAIGVLQGRAEYFTTYGYGTLGKAEAVAYVRDNIGGGAAFGPNEFAWEFDRAGVPFVRVSDFCQRSVPCVLEKVRDPRTAFLLFGQASNTVHQVRVFLKFTPELVGRKYAVSRIGDFWLYDLRPGAEPVDRPLRPKGPGPEL